MALNSLLYVFVGSYFCGIYYYFVGYDFKVFGNVVLYFQLSNDDDRSNTNDRNLHLGIRVNIVASFSAANLCLNVLQSFLFTFDNSHLQDRN